MQKLALSPLPTAGALLRHKLNRGTVAKVYEATEAPAAQRTSLFGPMFVRKAVQPLPTASKKPAALAVKPPVMRAPGEGADYEAGVDRDDPRQVHALQLRQSAAAHAALLASFKTIYSGPPTNPSKGPVGL